MAPTTSTPVVDHTLLVQPGRAADAILVGSPAWYAWLVDSSSFAFIGEHGSFTAHKERRGPAREYWRAYRRRAGRLHRAYLGKSAELTLDRLNAVAANLAGGVTGAAPTAREAALGTARDVTDAAADDRIGPQAAIVPPNMLSLPYQAAVDHTPVPALAPDDARPLHLLATKLALPASRPNLVPRQRLAEQLDATIGQGHKLILISAPAGFGKTTTIAEWLVSRTSELRVKSSELSQAQPTQNSKLKAQNFRVAWLSLDDDDNHLAQFLAYLIAALETVRPGIGATVWALLRTRAAQPPAPAILTTLVNALSESDDRIALVLDDYHTITLQPIHEAVTWLLDHLPARMQLIVISRADPPLPLARLRARGQLAEIRAADLRFTPEEATHFFTRVPGLRLPADAVAALEARTEGWVAGLQLAALSLQQQDAAQIPTFIADFTGSHHYVFDYLADEVFQRQPEHVRTFLMQTAILTRLCGPLCEAVTDQGDGQAMLEHLDQANLFLIRLDTTRRWYRYHHLFRDFLQERLERAVESAGRALLHRRASAWFAQHGLDGEAIDHALSAQAWDDAVRWLAPLMASERFFDYYLDWPRWLVALPNAALQADPDKCLRLAMILLGTGHVEAAERPLDLAEATWQAAGNQAKVGEVLGWRALAFYFKGDFPRAMNVAQQALARLPADAVEQRGVPTGILGFSDLSLGHLGSAMDLLIAANAALEESREPLLPLTAALWVARAYQLRGQLHHAAALYQDVIRRAGGATHQQQPSVYFYLGRLYYEWNDLASAERALHEGIAVGERTGRGRYWPVAYSALARVRWELGDAAQATFMMEQALAAARLLDSPPNIAEAEARQAGLWLVQGDLAAAVGWLTRRALNADDEVPYERQAEYLMLARIRIVQERQAPGSVDVNAIVRLLDRLRQAAEADERMYDQIAILALTALARAAQPDPSQALATLTAVLALAEPEGYIRTFVDEGAPMRALIADCRLRLARRVHGRASESGKRLLRYIDKLLEAFPQSVAAAPAPSAPPELLSAREIEVLRLIAHGRSVQEIAATLIISVHTTRTHIKNIYGKLEVHSRYEAIERARVLKLL